MVNRTFHAGSNGTKRLMGTHEFGRVTYRGLSTENVIPPCPWVNTQVQIFSSLLLRPLTLSSSLLLDDLLLCLCLCLLLLLLILLCL